MSELFQFTGAMGRSPFTEDDLKRLEGGCCLNDTVVDFGLQYNCLF
jgi:Ulp1 family protease